MTKTITILVVEDDEKLHELIQRSAERAAERAESAINLLLATSYNQAIELFNQSCDQIDAALVDFELSKVIGAHNGQDVVEYMRKYFQGPILAMSSSRPCNQMMVNAGCSKDYFDSRDGQKDYVRALNYLFYIL